tara:strand:- start:1087 stop:2085 length:999 start_codon:yes stop_codon:yes gene_type:complete
MSDPTLEAKLFSDNSLPIVNVSGLLSPAIADRKDVGKELEDACLNYGFFYITGHSVSSELRASVFERAQEFFALPTSVKEKINLANSSCNRGYEPLKGQTLEPGQPPDLKEGFYSGSEIPEDDQRVKDGKFNHGPNQWPDVVPEFKTVMAEYHLTMLKLGRLMMRGLALSLDLTETYFDGFCVDEIATLRILHYPPQPLNPISGEKGCGAHTDFGTITLLMQDDCGGLQVWIEEKGWVHVKPMPNTYVANLGDMMARWTNARYRSTRHRVINTSGRERYSVPFFYMGNPDFPVKCIPTCLKAGQPAKYQETTVEKHYQEMYKATYAPGIITS